MVDRACCLPARGVYHGRQWRLPRAPGDPVRFAVDATAHRAVSLDAGLCWSTADKLRLALSPKWPASCSERARWRSNQGSRSDCLRTFRAPVLTPEAQITASGRKTSSTTAAVLALPVARLSGCCAGGLLSCCRPRLRVSAASGSNGNPAAVVAPGPSGTVLPAITPQSPASPPVTSPAAECSPPHSTYEKVSPST